MKITLKRQTTWGCVRYFTVYKNGVRQKKLFNSITTEIEANVGDIITFKEGIFQFSKRIEVTSETKEITITTTNHIQQLFSLFIILFLAISLLCFSIQSLPLFLVAEISVFCTFSSLFRRYSYQFNIEKEQVRSPLRFSYLGKIKTKTI